MPSDTAVGRESYQFFLKNVGASLPAGTIACDGKQEWGRAVSSQVYEEHRNQHVPPLVLFKDQGEEVTRQKAAELSVRRYLEERNLLTMPSWVPHYEFAPTPLYLVPVEGLTEMDDFTSATRLHQNSTRYIGPPSATLGYFALTWQRTPAR